jgi:hypothetical protein
MSWARQVCIVYNKNDAFEGCLSQPMMHDAARPMQTVYAALTPRFDARQKKPSHPGRSSVSRYHDMHRPAV